MFVNKYLRYCTFIFDINIHKTNRSDGSETVSIAWNVKSFSK